MTAPSGLQEVRDADLHDALEQILVPSLADTLRHREPGHCMRVNDLEPELATRLSRRLRSAAGPALVRVLAEPGTLPDDVAVSSTKLVELRNPYPDGTARPPLLVFVPPGLRTSAEDSFGVATFEEMRLGDVYRKLATRLLERLPEKLRPGVGEIFALLGEERWGYADARSRARYLLTLDHNDHDPEAAGAAVFELGLIPDFELFQAPEHVRVRTFRNLKHIQELTESRKPERQRVVALGLTNPAFQARLAHHVTRVGLENPREWTRRIVADRQNWSLAFQHWRYAKR